MADAPKQPEVPAYQPFNTSTLLTPWDQFYQPQTSQDYMNTYDQMMRRAPYDYYRMQGASAAAFNKYYPGIYDLTMQKQMQYVPQLQELDRQGQLAMTQTMFNEAQRQMPIDANSRYQLDTQYMPANAYLNRQVTQIGAPEFYDTYASLGKSVNEGLSAGYDLGQGLSTEMEQAIRGAQSARGNWLGPAPTAQEAFGKGQAAIDLYNTRIGQAQGYIQGRNPTDLWGSAATTKPAIATPVFATSNSYVDPSMGANLYQNVAGQGTSLYGQVGTNASNVFSTVGTGQSNYNSALGASQGNYNANLLQASDQNNNWMFQGYDRQADAFMYNDAVAHGLYSTPQVGGGMGGMSSMMGGIGTAAAGVGGALITSGAVTGGAAIATGVGAAASAAAAALCWLARKIAPECWKSYRKYLFTKAPAEEREFYIFNARRLANTLG